MLLDQKNLIARFDELLSKSTELHIAVAWITSRDLTSKVIDFVRYSNGKCRILAGVGGNISCPVSLRRLYESGVLKIGFGSRGGLFHPKLFLFKIEREYICWIGSANMTDRGFDLNTELVHEHCDDGSALRWFETQWQLHKYFDSTWFDEYAKLPRPTFNEPQESMPRPQRTGDKVNAWSEYVKELRDADQDWRREHKSHGVLSGENSHLQTIRMAQRVVLQDWEDPSKAERDLLLGTNGHGALGTLRGAGRVVQTFVSSTEQNLRVRREIVTELRTLQGAALDSSFPSLASKSYEVITNHDGFGGASATTVNGARKAGSPGIRKWRISERTFAQIQNIGSAPSNLVWLWGTHQMDNVRKLVVLTSP